MSVAVKEFFYGALSTLGDKGENREYSLIRRDWNWKEGKVGKFVSPILSKKKPKIASISDVTLSFSNEKKIKFYIKNARMEI